MAHLSGDEGLCAIFQAGEVDVFRMLAARWKRLAVAQARRPASPLECLPLHGKLRSEKCTCTKARPQAGMVACLSALASALLVSHLFLLCIATRTQCFGSSVHLQGGRASWKGLRCPTDGRPLDQHPTQ